MGNWKPITVEEVLAEFEKIQQEYEKKGGEGITVREICETTGRSTQRVREMIRLLIQEGKAEPITVRRRAICGSMRPTWGYRFTKSKAKKRGTGK